MKCNRKNYMPMPLTVSKTVHPLSLSVYPDFWDIYLVQLQVSLNQWTAPNYVTILFLFVQTFISFILFNMPNPFPNCFHNSAYRLALLKIFLKLKTCIYTVKMVLNRVIYKYHNSWKGAKRYRAVVQCNRHILRTALVHFMCNQHISTRS